MHNAWLSVRTPINIMDVTNLLVVDLHSSLAYFMMKVLLLPHTNMHYGRKSVRH